MFPQMTVSRNHFHYYLESFPLVEQDFPCALKGFNYCLRGGARPKPFKYLYDASILVCGEKIIKSLCYNIVIVICNLVQFSALCQKLAQPFHSLAANNPTARFQNTSLFPSAYTFYYAHCVCCAPTTH